MKKYVGLILAMVMALAMIAGCTNDKQVDTDEGVTSNDAINEEEDEVTEKDLVERVLEESNKNTDGLLKESDFVLAIDLFEEFRQVSYIEENGEMIEISTRVADKVADQKTTLDGVAVEDYELSNGFSGIIGTDEYDRTSFIQDINDTDEYGIIVDLGSMEVEEGKKVLDGLTFREESVTEEWLKESTGVDYENIKFFDNRGTDYVVSEIAFRTGEENLIWVRYYNNESEDYDNIDIGISKDDFVIDEDNKGETIKTKEGKTVEVILYDGSYEDWLWEEDDGYNYRISHNFEESGADEREAMLDAIDNITKSYGE